MPLLTYTDRVIPLPHDVGAPSLVDIAVSLSRQPRFGGHTRRWWSVLDHLLFVDELAKLLAWSGRMRAASPQLRLALLLHDAHESVTADVPTDAKGPGLRILQKDLDRAIMGRYYPGGYAAYAAWEYEVKQWDRLALVAEANVVGPPVSERRLAEVEPVFAIASLPGAQAAVVKLDNILRTEKYLGVPPFATKSQASHPAVRQYLSRTVELM